MCDSCGVGISIPQGKEISAFCKRPNPASAPTQLSGWWEPSPFPTVKRETDLKKNSVALVRTRTIPTERPPPVGEVSANFLRIEGCHVVSATGPHSR